MTDYKVPVSYTVNVSLSAVPTGLGAYNTNSIAIFSNETANFNENYIVALTPQTVKEAFGSNSLTYKMANALFTPSFNFRTGDGYLYVFKYDGTNATQGTVTTKTLTSNLEGIKAVTDGGIKITIDGTDTTLVGLDFSAVSTVDDICKVLLAQNPDCYIYSTGTNQICFQSKRGGSSIALKSGATGTDLYGSSYFDGANATDVNGTSATGSIADAIDTALEQAQFGGVLTTQFLDDTTLLAEASKIQAKDVVFYNELQSLKDIAVTGSANKLAGNSKTRLLAYSMGAEEAKIAVATYATIAQSVNYTATDTANTLNLKTLTGVVPDTHLSDSYVLSASQNGVDIYGNTGGLACVYSNDNNGYTDDVVNLLRLCKDLEVGGFNYLRQTNTKIPQTEKGMTGLKSAYAEVCERFVNNGTVAPGSWNTAIPFGNPELFRENIEKTGYYIYSIPIAQQSQVDREARKAPICSIALKMAGSIHFSTVLVTVER
mgnify:CR=1 FL=1